MPYNHFFGFRKGEDDLPEIVSEEAETARFICSSFITGQVVYMIAITFTDRYISTPVEKEI